MTRRSFVANASLSQTRYRYANVIKFCISESALAEPKKRASGDLALHCGLLSKGKASAKGEEEQLCIRSPQSHYLPVLEPGDLNPRTAVK
jgi:hypothetical protein